ncbi:MAG TPA: nucleotide sugar epimerase [Persephonella sp.]|uniref:NAD-dependent epimerase/dehydratase family protein n=1 Tax=Persephonella marina (strain DSM 14350 / EX-H1) TaxID=123214 RepID=C0QU28_PERMH|nr:MULTISPECIES: SDR family NAD(P)-dependent oxidoreductase [Persephonella]ACO04490.1 NAD-dependent epimerase/dehydratase family protein [Persephonella marina EX-H1]HCB70190.1 nucleotide sugar epimerase [Persephonella sp.]
MQAKGQTVLVTGAAGFIGWKTSKLLLEGGFNVVGIDNMNSYYDVRLKEWRKKDLERYENFRFFHIDIENLGALRVLFDSFQFDAVLNLAARAGVRYSMENPHVYLQTNAQGTLNLLEMMKDHGIKKMVLASTSSLYAGQPMPFKEDLPVNTPISPYAASKKAAEVMAYTYHYLYGLDITVVRYFTVYGPAGRPDMSIFRFIKWIDEGKPIKLFGDGSQARDFTYVDDIAKGTVLAMKNLGYEIINLGGGKNPISLKSIIQKIEDLLGKKAVIEYRPFHKADMKETWADIEKAEKILGWRPEISIDEGLKRTVQWYIENREWLKDIKLEEGKQNI